MSYLNRRAIALGIETSAIRRLETAALPAVAVGDKVIINLNTARTPSYWAGVVTKVGKKTPKIRVEYLDGDYSDELIDETGTGLIGFVKGAVPKTEIPKDKLASKLDSKKWICKNVLAKLSVKPTVTTQQPAPPTVTTQQPAPPKAESPKMTDFTYHLDTDQYGSGDSRRSFYLNGLQMGFMDSVNAWAYQENFMGFVRNEFGADVLRQLTDAVKNSNVSTNKFNCFLNKEKANTYYGSQVVNLPYSAKRQLIRGILEDGLSDILLILKEVLKTKGINLVKGTSYTKLQLNKYKKSELHNAGKPNPAYSDSRLVSQEKPSTPTSSLDDPKVKAFYDELKAQETPDYQNRGSNAPRSGKPDSLTVNKTERGFYIEGEFNWTSERDAKSWMSSKFELPSNLDSLLTSSIDSAQTGDYTDDRVVCTVFYRFK